MYSGSHWRQSFGSSGRPPGGLGDCGMRNPQSSSLSRAVTRISGYEVWSWAGHGAEGYHCCPGMMS
eukprot:3241931-Rhodomonas_salina.1